MSQWVNFFEYAQLMHAGPLTERAPGELRRRGASDAAARFGSGFEGWVWGQRQVVTMAKLRSLIGMERHVHYRLTKVRLASGIVAYAFEYARKNFEDLELIEDGRFRGKRYGLTSS